MSTGKIKTPHAAILVWNYADRIGVPNGAFDSSGVNDLMGIEKEAPPVIVSTLSCVSIQTSKTKAQPDGQFNLILAPFKNWVSTLTAGSWCVIMMSNEPITEQDLKKANKNQVKMLGRIESVRCETSMEDDGTRKTLYYVTGVDWGHIFNSILYIDNLIAGPNEPKSQGNTAAVAIRNALFGKDGSPKSFAVRQNLANLLDIMGKNLGGYTELGKTIGRLSNSIYEFKIPDALAKFFDFRDPSDKKVSAKNINKLLTLTTGSLTAPDFYDDKMEAIGFLDPFSLQGTHSLWQILLENSNPALNEMLCDMKWSDKSGDNSVQLMLYNRIKPFSYKNFSPAAGKSTKLKSYFQLVKMHKLNSDEVISVNAGTNWRDKFNFIEIKPQFQDFAIIANWTKQKAQAFDSLAFEREGFRPLIFDTKQFPSGGKSGQPDDIGINWDAISEWTQLLREWYFGTHRTLNGTVVIHGTTEYIGVGSNIRFDAGLINPTPNINFDSKKKGKNEYILAHVEGISHSFSVSQDGARSYRTTIQFVRGIIVNENNINVGEGLLDQDVTKLSQSQDRNTTNVNSTSGSQDPDPQKVRGQ
jgi:hypothetical protein